MQSFLENLINAVVFLAVCAGIIAVGWHEPLRYRFMTREEIAMEGMLGAGKKVSAFDWHPQGTALDRAPYEVVDGDIEYSKAFDPRKMGAPTESLRRTGTIGQR